MTCDKICRIWQFFDENLRNIYGLGGLVFFWVGRRRACKEYRICDRLGADFCFAGAVCLRLGGSTRRMA